MNKRKARGADRKTTPGPSTRCLAGGSLKVGASGATEIKLLVIGQRLRGSSCSPLICLKPKHCGGRPTAMPARSSGNQPRVKLDKLPERRSLPRFKDSKFTGF